MRFVAGWVRTDEELAGAASDGTRRLEVPRFSLVSQPVSGRVARYVEGATRKRSGGQPPSTEAGASTMN